MFTTSLTLDDFRNFAAAIWSANEPPPPGVGAGGAGGGGGGAGAPTPGTGGGWGAAGADGAGGAGGGVGAGGAAATWKQRRILKPTEDMKKDSYTLFLVETPANGV